MLTSRKDSEIALEQLVLNPPRWLSAEVDPDGRGGEPAVLALCGENGAPFVVDLAQISSRFVDLFARLSCPVAAWAAKDVARGLLRRGFRLPERWACLRLTEVLIQGGRSAEDSFDAVSKTYRGSPAPNPSDGLDRLVAVPEAINDVVSQQAEALRRDELVWVSRIESAAVSSIAEMEHAGLPFDSQRWRGVLTDSLQEREQLRTKLAALLDAGEGDLFGNYSQLDSDAGLRDALAARNIDVPNLKRSTLAALPGPLGPTLARFRELGKLTQSYGESFLQHVQDDGRIRATFEQIGAPTGRMACHSPNLQAVVKDSQYREAFRAKEGRMLITADYAGCELRILAELSGEPVFHQVFSEGGDLHARVASTIFDVAVSKTEHPELRHRAKAVNFGLAYGMGARGLSRATGLSTDDSRRFLRRYFDSFPKIRDFLEVTAQTSVERGFARTMTGRRLYLEHDGSGEGRGRAERIAKNMPIQGTNADIVKIALARLRRAFLDTSTEVVNAVHDEIVVECDEPMADQVAARVKEEMRVAGATVLKEVPMVAEAVIGRCWAK